MHFSNFIRNVSYSFMANLVSFAISAILVLVAPKFLDAEDYGMWQLFLFYISFAGCCHLGWIDGIYLRYAGYSIDKLNPEKYSGQYVGLMALESVIGVGIFLFATLCMQDSVQRTILQLSSIFPLLYNLNLFSNFILQITNQIKKYAELVLIERITFLIGILVIITIGIKHFYGFYLVKTLSLVMSCFAGFYICKKLFVYPFDSVHKIFQEAKDNISVGLKLLIANTSSVLVIGVIRYGISEGWDIATFGRVSLTLSVSNFLMVFINAVSIVLFPALKRICSDQLPKLYLHIRDILSLILFLILIFYYPMRLILGLWLPQYASYLKYMVILFPICVFESKVILLSNTYLKNLRKEALMLKINLYAVLLSIIWTIFSVLMIHNLDIAVFGIVLACAFRSFISEFYLAKILNIELQKRIFDDFLLVLTFILSGYFFENFTSTFIYTIVLSMIFYSNRRSIILAINGFRER